MGQCAALLQRLGIERTVVKHAKFAERVIGSIKTIEGKFLTYTESMNYIDSLDLIVQTYNTREHRAIKMTPEQAEREENARSVRFALSLYYRKQENSHRHSEKKPRYPVGTHVRIERPANIFQRRNLYPSMTTEIFVVKRVILHHRRHMYCLATLKGVELAARYYEEQLVRAELEKYKIQRVHRGRQRINPRGEREVLVSFQGLPSPEMDQYVPVNKLSEYVKARNVGLDDISKQTSAHRRTGLY